MENRSITAMRSARSSCRASELRRAQCVVFAISDPVATRQAVATARRLNASTYIIARTRYIAEIEQLYDVGADTVIAEEFETSLEIIRRILGRFGYRPDNHRPAGAYAAPAALRDLSRRSNRKGADSD